MVWLIWNMLTRLEILPQKNSAVWNIKLSIRRPRYVDRNLVPFHKSAAQIRRRVDYCSGQCIKKETKKLNKAGSCLIKEMPSL